MQMLPSKDKYQTLMHQTISLAIYQKSYLFMFYLPYRNYLQHIIQIQIVFELAKSIMGNEIMGFEIYYYCIICVLAMKRRNNRKCDSFDFIKFSPKRASSHTNSSSLRQPQYCSPTLQAQSSIKQKHHLQLPKIHAIHPIKLKRIDRQRERQRQIQVEYSGLQNRLLLLGYQYRRETQLQRERDRDREKEKESEKEIERQYNYREQKRDRQLGLNSSANGQHNRKKVLNKQYFVSKKMFNLQILGSFGVSEVLLEKKKVLVYVEEGNNSRMVKEMIRKRPHLVFVNDKKQANLVWTRFCDYQSSKLSCSLIQQYSVKNSHQSQQDHQTEISKLSQSANHSPQPSSKSTLLLQQPAAPTLSLLVSDLHMHNHLTNHYQISDKKSLFSNLQKYCIKNKMSIFDLVPLTFQIKNGGEGKPTQLPNQIGETGFWFIKPGEDTNRGNGISIASGRDKIKGEVEGLLKIGKTALVQQYIDPLLYRNRKFDIRCYALVFSFRGQLKAYWYKEGYIRTCSKEFSYDITDLYAHLTNDAIQKKSPLYGKYEQSNKLSFSDLQAFLRTRDISFKTLQTQMKSLASHSILSAEHQLRHQKSQINFQIFGYDYLIDKKGKIWLIQINTNPCLQFTGSLTARVIGHMIDNSLRIVLDPIISGEGGGHWKEQYTKVMEENKYEVLI